MTQFEPGQAEKQPAGHWAAGSEAIQDYVKTIFKLQQADRPASTSAIAEKLGISAASVTGMLKKLDRLGLLAHNPYHGVALTASGRRMALEMIRHHRLIELYLQRALGFSWDQVDAEAERLEHAISEAMEAAMAAYLGDPTEDPHGDPIPSKDGELNEVRYEPLSTVPPGETVRIRRVKDSDPALLRYLGELGMYPHALVSVLDREPFDGPLTVQAPNGRQALGSRVTESVFVERLGPGAGGP